MEMVGSVVAVYGDHNSAEAAVKKTDRVGLRDKKSQRRREGIP